jgi:hypothetical protein
MVTDPRKVLKDLFDPSSGSCKVTGSNLYIEDGSTVAKYECSYESQPAVLSRLMVEDPFNYDLIFVVSFIDEDAPDDSASGPINYNYLIGVQPVTIHKYGSDGAVTVNGDKLGYKAEQEIKRVIRENPYGSLRNVRGMRRNVERVGKDLIYGNIVPVLYSQYATRY